MDECAGMRTRASSTPTRRHEYVSRIKNPIGGHYLYITPLDILFSRHRICKSHIPFSSLPTNCRKDFCDKAAKYNIDKGVKHPRKISTSESVARQFGLAIASCNYFTVHRSVSNRVIGKKQMSNILSDIRDVTTVANPPFLEVVNAVGGAQKRNANCLSKCGRKRKEDGALPSSKL